MHTSSTDLFQRLWQELALPPGATRPPLSEQEVECLMRDRVSLLDGPWSVIEQGRVDFGVC